MRVNWHAYSLHRQAGSRRRSAPADLRKGRATTQQRYECQNLQMHPLTSGFVIMTSDDTQIAALTAQLTSYRSSKDQQPDRITQEPPRASSQRPPLSKQQEPNQAGHVEAMDEPSRRPRAKIC